MVLAIKNSPILTEYEYHCHNDYEMVCVTGGNMQVLIDGQKHYMKKGDIAVLPPKTMHGGINGSEYRDTYLFADHLPFSTPQIIHEYDESIYRLFKLIDKLFSEKEKNYTLIADKLLSAIVEYIRKYVDTEYKYPFVAQIKNKIYKNIDNSAFSISEEVKRIGYNTDYFRRCFRDEVGCTPTEYMTKLRLQRAEGLLKDSRYDGLGAIAEQCGYNDYFYFSRSFKEMFGVSPREYRKNFFELYSRKGVGES